MAARTLGAVTLSHGVPVPQRAASVGNCRNDGCDGL
jgi:hypothetical protein